MKAHGFNMEGPFKGDILSTLPIWTSDDEGREVYVEDTQKRYYADGTAWVDYAVAGGSGTSGTSGTSGASGSSGTSGESGSDGTSGTSGIDGTSGSSGTSGATGDSGTSGTSGESGSDGTSGSSGISGTSGSSGDSGTSGSSGVSGTSGSSGDSGTSGSSGVSGTSGTSGVNGTSGTSGVNGTSGTSGVNGTSGTSGDSGTSGSSGDSGTSGSSGDSGTSGSSGDSGTSGSSGDSGTSGTSGIDGTSGTSGSSGSSAVGKLWYYDDSTSDISGYRVATLDPDDMGAEVTYQITVASADGEKLIEEFITKLGDPGVEQIPSGVWNGMTYADIDNATGSSYIKMYMYKRSAAGVETELCNTTSDEMTVGVKLYLCNKVLPSFLGLESTDRLVWKIYAYTSSVQNRTVTLYTEGVDNVSRIQSNIFSGAYGTSGTSGTSGDSGTSGTSGVNGTSGTSGDSGTSGTSGIDGTSGTSGVAGTSGTSGDSGSSGTSGATGTSGTSGNPTFDPDCNGDHSVSGINGEMTVGENVAFGNIAYMKSDGKLWKTDADNVATMPALVFIAATISADAAGTVMFLGFARDDSWNWTIGDVIYASLTTGAITQTAPSSTGDVVQVIGIATHADRIYFNPNQSYGVIE